MALTINSIDFAVFARFGIAFFPIVIVPPTLKRGAVQTRQQHGASVSSTRGKIKY
jgi:hypothetical protein